MRDRSHRRLGVLRLRTRILETCRTTVHLLTTVPATSPHDAFV